MDMNGEQRIPTGQQAVWEALNDLEVLKACIPGCDSIEKVSDTEHHVTLTAAVGPVKAKFKGRMHLGDLDPPHSYRIGFEGQGGVAGFAKGEAQVALKPDGADTLMNYTVHAQVGGKLAQVGSRLIDAAAKKLADEFFNAFNARVAPAAAEAAAAPKPAAGVPIWVWIAAAIAAIVALLFAMR
jgi:carbon monoxide dehydrogenase subunit G